MKGMFHMDQARKHMQAVSDSANAEASTIREMSVELGEKCPNEHLSELRASQANRADLVKDVQQLLADNGIENHPIYTKGNATVLSEIKRALQAGEHEWVKGLAQVESYVDEKETERNAQLLAAREYIDNELQIFGKDTKRKRTPVAVAAGAISMEEQDRLIDGLTRGLPSVSLEELEPGMTVAFRYGTVGHDAGYGDGANPGLLRMATVKCRNKDQSELWECKPFVVVGTDYKLRQPQKYHETQLHDIRNVGSKGCSAIKWTMEQAIERVAAEQLVAQETATVETIDKEKDKHKEKDNHKEKNKHKGGYGDYSGDYGCDPSDGCDPGDGRSAPCRRR